MSGAKGPILLIAGGCAAMAGAAALVVSFGSFFVDLPTTPANAAVVAELPVKKVKTVALKQSKPAASAQPAEPQQAATRQAETQKPSSEEVAAAVQPDEDALNHTDPRWARNTANSREATGVNDKLEAAFAAQEQGSAAGSAATAELGKAGEPLSMLSSVDNSTELEPAIDEAPKPAPRRNDAADDDEPRGGKAATISRGVNLRSSPRSGSRVLGTVPAGAKIALASDCRNWCRITYNGRTGYVWRDYVSGAGRAVAKQRTRRTAARQVEQQPAQPSDAGLFGNPGTINNDGIPGSARARAGAAQAAAAAAAKTPEKPAFVPVDK